MKTSKKMEKELTKKCSLKYKTAAAKQEIFYIEQLNYILTFWRKKLFRILYNTSMLIVICCCCSSSSNSKSNTNNWKSLKNLKFKPLKSSATAKISKKKKTLTRKRKNVMCTYSASQLVFQSS